MMAAMSRNKGNRSAFQQSGLAGYFAIGCIDNNGGNLVQHGGIINSRTANDGKRRLDAQLCSSFCSTKTIFSKSDMVSRI